MVHITLQSSMEQGEKGLLPRGACGSSNMGSSGTMFSSRITE
jgi:hypothetical protein